MGGLIVVIIGFLLSVVFGIRMGADIVADDMKNKHRINGSEYEYMKSWDYLTEILQHEIQNRK